MTIASTTAIPDNREYDAFLQRVQARLDATTPAPLFTTDATDLYTVFLDALPTEWRQYHTCYACRRFVEQFGGLVTIDDRGDVQSALWHQDDTPEFYEASVKAMLHAIRRAAVTGVFYSAANVWGTPVTLSWHHLAATPPSIFSRMTQTAGQAMAEKREDYQTLQRALADFTPAMLTTAVNLLKTESLYRSEKVLGVAEWLLELQGQRANANGTRRDNLTWRAVATAPAGFCHPRSGMIGTLLEDIAEGLDFAEVSRRFAAKMHPLQYQRPQAAPTAGNIAQAEKIIEQLQAKNALARRFARLDDLETLWTPAPVTLPHPSGDVFGHLLPKGQQTKQAITPPATKMTWEKFQRTVLPTAKAIAFYTPPGHDNYVALVTAVDPEAPLIFQWNNPVSLYVYHGGSLATDWNLPATTFVPVTAITLRPSQWGAKPMEHQGAGVIFMLKAAKDMRYRTAGAAIFPETLRSEFHGIRATIEAFSRSATIQDADQASACGVFLSKGGDWTTRFRVTTTTGMVAEYHLDRWD